MSEPRQLSGVLLCHVGDRRLAVPAQEIAAIEPRPLPGRNNAFARRAFGLPDQPGRVVITARGEALVVDSLEVLQSSIALLPAPPSVQQSSGNSIEGFIEARGSLWPVITVPRFAAYARTLERIAEPSGDVL